MLYRVVTVVSIVLLMNTWALSQVPIDLSRAKEFKLVQRFDLGGQISSIAYNEGFCGVTDLNVITTGVSGRGRVTWKTTPLIDTTNVFNWLGIRSPYILVPFDNDGVAPIEYINANGIVWRCSQGESPFPLMPIDTIANDVCSASPATSGDVDGDGALDVITEIGRNGVTTRVILGGPLAGNGCERVLVVPVVKAANKKNLTKAFYKSATGEWRLIQEERDSIDRAPRLQMYRVNFTRTMGKPDVTFTPLGMYQGDDVSLIDEPFGDVGVVPDSVNNQDHMLFHHRIGKPGSVWALERFVITDGNFRSSGEIVAGYDFMQDIYIDFQYSLGTKTPVVMLTNQEGSLFCYINNMTTPFAKWNPTGSGTQPLIGMSSINDQSGDNVPDVVVVGGSLTSAMVVLTLDSTSTSTHIDDTLFSPYSIRKIGSVLEVATSIEGSMSISIISVDGRLLRTTSAVMIAPGVTRIDIEPHLRQLANGQYFLSVSVNGLIQTLPINK